jgi:cytochrome oxidase assembly protein ShyY1
MNLFDFDNSNHGFSISYQFWIFVVIAVPLTLLTLGTWYLLTKRRLEEMKKKKQEKGMV